MQRSLVLVFFYLLSATSFAQHSDEKVESEAEQWRSLLDSSLSQWDSYLSYRFKPGYDGAKPPEAPVGFNQPAAAQVFSVSVVDGEPVLRVSGEIYGALISKRSYRNYHLKVQVQWGQKKWPARADLLRDTGILYHSIGPYGADHWRSWMLSQELQIMEGHIGDYWSQATSAMDIRAFPPEYIMNPVASLEQPFLSVGYEQAIKGFVLRRENRESQQGWTDVELICYEGQSLHIVNGEVVMVLRNSRYKEGSEFLPLREGKIQLQSEAAEVFFRQIQVRELNSLPVAYERLF
ncbi:hypothetical protein R50072_14360 [Simiduia litorea]|uniref:3-keto-disaccharide hydrolase n=1 Tax=Simiduia litorea TaxID=1435348 RepID=UPI0036F449F8